MKNKTKKQKANCQMLNDLIAGTFKGKKAYEKKFNVKITDKELQEIIEDHNEFVKENEVCPNCGSEDCEAKPVQDIYEGEHFQVWGNEDFMTINFHYNDITLTFPAELWEVMRNDFSTIGLIPAPGSRKNGSVPPDVELN